MNITLQNEHTSWLFSRFSWFLIYSFVYYGLFQDLGLSLLSAYKSAILSEWALLVLLVLLCFAHHLHFLVCCAHYEEDHTTISGVHGTPTPRKVCTAHHLEDHTSGVRQIWCAIHTIVFTVYGVQGLPSLLLLVSYMLIWLPFLSSYSESKQLLCECNKHTYTYLH